MNQTQLPDLWEQLEELFAIETEDNPEILINDADSYQLHTCILHLLRDSRMVNSVYRLRRTRQEVGFVSITPEILAAALVGDELEGVLLLEFPMISQLIFHFDRQDGFSISYSPGHDWNALKVIAFFDLLWQLHRLIPEATFELNPFSFEGVDLQPFANAIQDYLDGIH